MPLYSCSLRDVVDAKPAPDRAMQLFSYILDGVEAAHFQHVTHRDLKPENVLIDDADIPGVSLAGPCRTE
jgi:serine/threonine protein kinase